MTMQEKERRVVLELEEWLDADTNGELASEIMHRLSSISERLKKKKQALQTAETYQAITAAERAVEAATLTMRMYLASKS